MLPAFSKMPKKDPAAQLVTLGGLHFLKCQKKDPAAQLVTLGGLHFLKCQKKTLPHNLLH